MSVGDIVNAALGYRVYGRVKILQISQTFVGETIYLVRHLVEGQASNYSKDEQSWLYGKHLTKIESEKTSE